MGLDHIVTAVWVRKLIPGYVRSMEFARINLLYKLFFLIHACGALEDKLSLLEYLLE